MVTESKEKIKRNWEITLDAFVVVLTLFFNWCDDKNLVIFAIILFGCVALFLNPNNSIDLIKNLTAGLLGMAIGKGISK